RSDEDGDHALRRERRDGEEDPRGGGRDGRSWRGDDRVQSGSGSSINERIDGPRRVSHSSKSPSRSITISSLPSFISVIRPGASVRSGITSASREIPSESVIEKIRSIS